MSIVISGALVIVTFILVSMLTFSTFITTTDSQGTSLKQAAALQATHVAENISIASTSSVDVAGGTQVTADIDNDGASSFSRFSKLDVLFKYVNGTGDQVSKRLTYVCKQLCGSTGDPGDDQWTITSISPDGYNPKMWDPDERATFLAMVVPSVQVGSQGTVVAVVPGGASDLAYFTN